MYQIFLMNHLRAIEQWAEFRRATASIQIPGSVLRVQWRNRTFDFQPQFLVGKPSGGYTAGLQLTDKAFGFAGWLPYFNKRWDAGCGKLAFKQFAEREGIPTPAYSFVQGEFTNVLVKREKSSLGEGLRGPFRSVSPASERTRLRDGEYYENFIFGRVFKVLYWNAKPVCADLFEMASVIGNGQQTIGELVRDLERGRAQMMPQELLETMIEYQDWTLNTILQPGERCFADCRFGSPLFKPGTANENVLTTINAELRNKFEQAGQILERSIPQAFRRNTAFSADGVVADDGTIWFLEMNCNPMLHPDAYPAILDSLFFDADVIEEEFKPLHMRYDVRSTNPPIRYLSEPPVDSVSPPSPSVSAL